MMNNSRPLTTGDVARYCHVTPQAVLKWIKAGKLEAYSTPGGQNRIEQWIFVEFLHKYRMPIPLELQKAHALVPSKLLEQDW